MSSVQQVAAELFGLYNTRQDWSQRFTLNLLLILSVSLFLPWRACILSTWEHSPWLLNSLSDCQAQRDSIRVQMVQVLCHFTKSPSSHPPPCYSFIFWATTFLGTKCSKVTLEQNRNMVPEKVNHLSSSSWRLIGAASLCCLNNFGTCLPGCTYRLVTQLSHVYGIICDDLLVMWFLTLLVIKKLWSIDSFIKKIEFIDASNSTLGVFRSKTTIGSLFVMLFLSSHRLLNFDSCWITVCVLIVKNIFSSFAL